MTAIARPTKRLFFVMPQDVSWWVWLITACLLVIGLAGYPEGFVAAICLSMLQSVAYLIPHRRLSAFPVQLRVAYTLLLIACFFPPMRWLFWLPTVGTFALNIFGYCLMARCLSLLPWNRRESITFDLLSRTFISRPIVVQPASEGAEGGCAGGVCSIESQVRQRQLATTEPDL